MNSSKLREILARYLQTIVAWAGTFLLVGLLVVALKGPVIGFVWAMASLGVGVVVGFLFGFPRTVPRDSTRTPSTRPGVKAEDTDPASNGEVNLTEFRQLPNTHLEEISDWLTKIIVGVTLVQFREIAAYFRDCARMFGSGLTGGETSENVSFAQATIVYFAVLGFLTSFLLTRLLMARALRASDELMSMKKQLAELKQVVTTEVAQLRQQVETVNLADDEQRGSPVARRRSLGS